MTAPWAACSILVVLQDMEYLLPHPGYKGEEEWNSCLFTRTSCNLPWFVVRAPNFILKTFLSSFRGLTSHCLRRRGSRKAKFALLKICNFKILLYSSFANPMSTCRLLEVAFAANTGSSELNLACKQK